MKYFFCTLLLVAFAAFSSHAEIASFGSARNFDEGWLFILDDDSLAREVEYVDTLWRKVTLPHDWSIEMQPSPYLASCTGYRPGGIGWYRKKFRIDDDAANHYLYFEGVYNRSDVYINGHHLGHRPNGYVSFMYDLTPYLHDGENTVAVRVDHSRYADSRWYTGSGIYRNVYLIAAPRSHFALWGIDYQALTITDKVAKVQVRAQIENPQKGMSVEAALFNADGDKVAVGRSGIDAEGLASFMLNVKDPIRWDTSNPYLYRLEVNLRDGKKIIDTDVERVGLRTLDFNPNTGFVLNGRNFKVKGVCLHHDAGVLGAAVPRDVWKRRLNNLKDMGANAIRMSHNPQAPVVYDLCDELGLLVMDEASDEWEFPKRKWISGWNIGTPAFDGSADFFEQWIERDVKDMVRRDRNHPCVFLWSIGNEVDYPNDPYSHPVLDSLEINQPMFGGYDPEAPSAERIGTIAKRLVACVKAVDTSRPTTGALAGVVMSNQTDYPTAVDLTGYNYSEFRYDEDHAQYPDRIIYGSETNGSYEAWKAVNDRDFIFGQFVWTGTDYLGESGRWPSRGLNTGLLDFCSLLKPRGHFRKALWSENPYTYVGAYPMMRRHPRFGNLDMSQWVSMDSPGIWNYEPGQEMRVTCYTNSPFAMLMLNDTVVGEIKPYDTSNGIIYWDIPFVPGTLTAIGCDSLGNPQSQYQLVTSDRPYALRARIDGEYTAMPGGVNHLLIEVVDADGNLVTLADNEITCRIEGDARLLGLENSDNADMSQRQPWRRRAYQGRLLAYVRNGMNPEGVKILLSSPLLKPTTLDL